MCYYINWLESRVVVDFWFYLKEYLDFFLCIYFIYVFVNINLMEFWIEWVYFLEDDGKVFGFGLMFDFMVLKKKNLKLKIVLLIGGEYLGEF